MDILELTGKLTTLKWRERERKNKFLKKIESPHKSLQIV